MFDVSLIELAVIALVALLVLGPERLPRAARTVGLYVRKARASWYSVRADIERELAADELKRSIKRSGDELRDSIGIDRMREDITGRKRLPAQSAAATAAATEPSVDAPPETIDGDPAPTPSMQSTADTPPRA
ncbi:Sec-independent protein translocase protein TatB [Chiayiivirga flava]|uniref:Sec-independent protein translocase protein TatB n=1 Tax=Chiayiivirga flava TaxID=659595 RepID=A0A7W8D829_9GAMM|nr:sec-independent protein translocase protein TatB [Chiayiivirga flava]